MRFHTSLPVTSIAETVAFYRVLFASNPVKAKRLSFMLLEVNCG